MEYFAWIGVYLFKFLKFCLVGGTGAIITWGLTWLFTESIKWWYMQSLVFATFIATIWNFTWNAKWTFGKKIDPNSADYEWNGFYNGGLVQKWWKRRIANIVWEWIPDSSKLLNVGCGSSPIATKYIHSMNVDANERKLEFMREKMPLATFKNGDAQHLEFLDGFFDYVICLEVIEHVPYPERVIKELSRVTRPGGRVVIATPDYSKTLWHIAEMFTPYKEWHGAKLTKTAVESMCREQGLSLIKYAYVAGCDLIEMFIKE